MDNKAYLDQIAVKTKVKSGPLLTPMLIKLIVAGVIVLIALIVVGSIISGANAKVTQSYERVYLRIHNLSDNSTNPFRKYTDKIRNSDLRAKASTFFSVITTADNDVSSVIGSVGVKTDKISKEVSNAESVNVATIAGQLEDAVNAGNLDRIYATNISYQISTLIQYEAEAMKKNKNQNFANILQQSTNNLLQLQEQFNDWLDTH